MIYINISILATVQDLVLALFLFIDRSYGKKATTFRADMSLSVHVNNKGKDILILGEGPT